MDRAGHVSVQQRRILEEGDCGFDAKGIIDEAHLLKSKELELVCFLEWGFYDYYPKAPQVSTLSAHSHKAMSVFSSFNEMIMKEVSAGWIDE